MTGTLYERNLKWQENKEKRLQKERKKESKEEIRKCTFRPNIKESVNTFDRRQKVVRPGSGKEAKGINQFLQRLQAAQQKKIEDAESMFRSKRSVTPKKSPKGSNLQKLWKNIKLQR